MRFFGDAASKLLWGLVIVLAIAAGMAWFVRAFLQPPDLSASQSNLPAPVTTPNDQTTSPDVVTSDDSDPSQVSTTDTSTTTTTTDSSTTTAPDTATTPGTETLPAIAQAEDVVVKVPNQVEKGGILKLFTNNDGNDYPDPIQYSPEKILKTTGLSLIGISERGKFQEVSGYLLVEETGNYNFTIDYPESWQYWAREKSNFRMKIDGQTLPTSKGGRVSLEKGWHTVSLFLNASVDGNLFRVSWGREGETLKPIVIWREVEEKTATTKPSQTSEPNVASKKKDADAKPDPEASISKTQEGQ
jgi:hypothetical protein